MSALEHEAHDAERRAESVVGILHTNRAIVEVLDALLDCGYCEMRPELMREHVIRLRAYYNGERGAELPPPKPAEHEQGHRQ